MDLGKRILQAHSMLDAVSISIGSTDISDEDAKKVPVIFPEWESERHYNVNQIVQYQGKLWRCVQDHDSQDLWAPSTATASIWSPISFDEEGVEEWIQPTGAHNAYSKGDIVTHNGKKWESKVDGNVWEPGIPGTDALWVEIQ